MATSTPWGEAQQSESLCRGIMQYSTAGHGGVHLSPTRNMVVPDYMRNDAGWYEEDCEWAIAATIFPEAWVKHYPNTIDILKIIKSTLMEYYPEHYEKFYNVTLKEGESSERDKQVFNEKYKDAWIVISASALNNYIECYAVLGGRDAWNENKGGRTFYVSKEEYGQHGAQGFIIDLNKHVEKGSLPTWQTTMYNHGGDVDGNSHIHSMGDMADIAYNAGYKYICWNDRIYVVTKEIGLYVHATDTGLLIDDVN